MTKKSLLAKTTLSAALFCAMVTLAQEPVVNISKNSDPNLAAAQELVAEANRSIIIAQRVNKYNMGGHAEKARQLLVQANDQLKLAALANPNR